MAKDASTVVDRHRRQRAHKARLILQGRPKRAPRGRVLNTVGSKSRGGTKTDAVDLTTPIEELDLTVRAYNVLDREGVRTLGQLVDKTEAELLDYRNFGQKSLDDVKAKLPAGVSLKQ